VMNGNQPTTRLTNLPRYNRPFDELQS